MRNMQRSEILGAIVVAVFCLGAKRTNWLEVRSYPRVHLASPGVALQQQWIAEIKGPETEEWYCPTVTWEFPDGTKSSHESDCVPFEERNLPQRSKELRCQPYIKHGELVEPECLWGQAPGFQRQFLHGAYLRQTWCETDSGMTINPENCVIKITVRLEKAGA